MLEADGKNTQPHDTNPDEQQGSEMPVKKEKQYIIKHKWLRILLKTLMWIVVALLLLPVLIYIPPVQTLLKNVACDVVYDSTGMKIGIDKFRLRFPLDVELDGVSVLTAPGDTMVMAKQAIADVKLLPLLKLDVQINKLQLLDGYYRMVSSDSSMVMKIRAHQLDVYANSSANISKSEITLGDAYLKDGDVQLYMNVWKQEPTPQDTTTVPFVIRAGRLRLENFTYAMSMLPTIDTLTFNAKKLELTRGLIDLRNNVVDVYRLKVDGGNARYVTPTPQYIASHPVPVDSTAQSAPPMIIKCDSLAIDNFSAVYAMKGAVPQPGFDANYISFTDLGIGLRNFYNKASTVVLPITRLTGKERCGLQLMSGSGTVNVDSTGIALQRINVTTPYTTAKLTAGVPFALMEMQPTASVNVFADISLGMPDIESFFPAAKTYIRLLPERNPVKIVLNTAGTLNRLNIERFDASIRNTLSLRAKGYANDALNIKKLVGALDIEGELLRPSLISKFVGDLGVPIPQIRIKGDVKANRETYSANLAMNTSDGNVKALGRVSMNAESYTADVAINDFNLAPYTPGMGLGRLTGNISAKGNGFDPLRPSANSNVTLNISQLHYNGRDIRDIDADVTLHDSHVVLVASGSDPIADFDISGEGTLRPDNYTFDVNADLRNLDLQALGVDSVMNRGMGRLALHGTAQPSKWIYDVDAELSDLDWQLGEQRYSFTHAASLNFSSGENFTRARLESMLTSVDFDGEAGLQRFITAFTRIGGIVEKQMKTQVLDVDTISTMLPRFTLSANASGRGLLSYLLEGTDVRVDTVGLKLEKDSLIRGNIFALGLGSGSINTDTLQLNLKQRNKLMDYAVHLGNRPGTLDEFANVDLTGYLGENRLSAFLTQQNISGQTGYRLGFTAAIQGDDVSVHFTPRKATIAYIPWTFNADNFVDMNLRTRQIEANLQTSSKESSILLATEPSKEHDGNQLHLNLTNIRIEDFTNMFVGAPDIKGAINSDMTVFYDGKQLYGKGSLGVSQLSYEEANIGDLDLDLKAGVDLNGVSRAEVGMKVDGATALTLHTMLRSTPDGLEPDSLGITLTKFPLKVANPFLGADMAQLSGALDGEMSMSGQFTAPVLNGYLLFDNVQCYIPMIGSSLKLNDDEVDVKNNIVEFSEFKVWGANNNPIIVNGNVDARRFNKVAVDLGLNASNFQLMNNDKRSKSDLYGKLFMNMNVKAKGPVDLLDIAANVNVLSSTDVTYNIPDANTAISQVQDNNLVRFVNLQDTTQVASADSVTSMFNMRITAALTLSPGMQATVNLSGNGTDKVELSPSGTLNYFQNYMGDMKLNGQLNLGNGFARYNIPVMGEKMFTFNQDSYVLWNGDIMNPTLNITATDQLKASVAMNGGNSHLVTFLIKLNVANTLSDPKIAFDLSADDDMSVQNEITSMSPDQRSTQAMNLLLYGQYTGPGSKTMAGPLTGNLYGFLASQVNSWAAKNIRGVDLTFGVDQYDKSVNGQNSTTTSYSYQVSKSLFNNRFKISVGGNYEDDSSSEDIADNLFSDISLEYILKQTTNATMFVKLFRQNSYESILEGEITETGVGFVMKRKLNKLIKLGKSKHKKVTPDDKTKNVNDTVK